MNHYQTSIALDESKQITLSNLPFAIGQKLKVIIVPEESEVDLEIGLEENAQIDAIMQQYHQAGKLRPVGLCAGEFVVPDDFNEPLPDEIIDLFYSE
jgi:hypothetical protein